MKRLFLLLPLILIIGCGSGTQKAGGQATEAIAKKVVSDERMREIRRWITVGRLGFNFNENKAFMDRHLWGSLDYNEKLELAQDLAIYIANRNESDVYEVIIVDKSSAERMAEYDSFGFRTFEF